MQAPPDTQAGALMWTHAGRARVSVIAKVSFALVAGGMARALPAAASQTWALEPADLVPWCGHAGVFVAGAAPAIWLQVGALPPRALARSAAAPAHEVARDYPRSFDFTRLQRAPPEGGLPAFAGDERLALRELGAGSDTLETRLPGVALEVEWAESGEPTARGSLPLIPDTLGIDLRRRVATIVWRGVLAFDRSAQAPALELRVVPGKFAAVAGAMVAAARLFAPAASPEEGVVTATAPPSELAPTERKPSAESAPESDELPPTEVQPRWLAGPAPPPGLTGAPAAGPPIVVRAQPKPAGPAVPAEPTLHSIPLMPGAVPRGAPTPREVSRPAARASTAEPTLHSVPLVKWRHEAEEAQTGERGEEPGTRPGTDAPASAERREAR